MLERYTSIHPELVYKGVHHYRRFCVTSFGLQSFFFWLRHIGRWRPPRVETTNNTWRQGTFFPLFWGITFLGGDIVTVVHPVNHLKRWCLKWILRKPCLLATRGVWPAKTNVRKPIYLFDAFWCEIRLAVSCSGVPFNQSTFKKWLVMIGCWDGDGEREIGWTIIVYYPLVN